MAAAQAIQVQKTNLPETYDEESLTKDTPPPQKLGGLFFWMTGGLALTKDLIVDPLVAAGQSAGIALFPTIIMLPVGMTIWAVSFGVGVIITCTIWLTIQAYFYTHGGVHMAAKLKRLIAWLFAIFVGFIPYLSMLPETTLLFFAVAWLENAIRQNNLAAHALRYGVDKFAK